jgi:hypothetical protein
VSSSYRIGFNLTSINGNITITDNYNGDSNGNNGNNGNNTAGRRQVGPFSSLIFISVSDTLNLKLKLSLSELQLSELNRYIFPVTPNGVIRDIQSKSLYNHVKQLYPDASSQTSIRTLGALTCELDDGVRNP